MADYSTTMGILQPQVGKSGDILLKFEHKNGGERGIRTLGELPHTTFPMWRLRPLDHLSGSCSIIYHLNYCFANLFLKKITFFCRKSCECRRKQEMRSLIGVTAFLNLGNIMRFF